MNQAAVANLAKRSAARTDQTAIGGIGNCAPCAAAMGLSGLGCDCDKTGVPNCNSCSKKMGLGFLSTTSALGLVVLLAIGAGVAWKMGLFGKKAVASRKRRNRRKR